MRGAAFRSLSDQWADTTTPHGRLMLTVLGGLAEFERELIRARTGDGTRPRQGPRAFTWGDPLPSPSINDRRRRRRFANGTATQADLARRFNVSQSTISRLAEKAAPLPARPVLDAATERTGRAFMQRLEGRYPVREAILYGSRARQTHSPDSDADIAVVLEGDSGNRWEMTRELSGIAFDVLLETGIRVQALPLWESDLKSRSSSATPRSSPISSAKGCGYDGAPRLPRATSPKQNAPCRRHACFCRPEARTALATAPTTRCTTRRMPP